MNSVIDRVTWQLSVGEGWWPWLLAAALASILIAMGVRAVLNLPRRRAVVLITLRVALSIAVVLMALQLETQRRRVSVTSAPIAIIVDTSASMGVRDQSPQESGQATRLQAAQGWLASRDEALKELASRTSVDLFAASGGGLTSLGTHDELGGIVPAGGTDLLASLRALAERHAGRRRPAVLLLSDGADHFELANAVARGADIASLVPPGGGIVAVAPGLSGFVDRSVELIERDPVGFLRTDITVHVRVHSTGLPAGDVPVSLLRGEEVVQVRSTTLASGSADVTFHLTPQRVGEALYRVQVPLASGEAVPGNNEVPFSVRIVRDRIRVLQVVGRPSWDGRFLRELLKRDPAVDLISFFILRSQYDDTNADVDELSLIPFPVAELFDEKLDSFDLVIFQNFSLLPHGIEPYADSIARVVSEHGSGLAIIGGDLALGREWAGPELSDILPVRIAADGSFDPAAGRLRLAPGGERHPIMLLGDDDAASVLLALPSVTGVHRGLIPKDGASVMLETADAAARPVVVGGEAGAGRVLVVATDGTWRWSLPMAGKTGSARTYERFWENALRWLVKDERSSLLLLEADRRALAPGESVELRVALRSQSYQPEPGMPVTITVRDAVGVILREEALETADDGVARLAFEPTLPGVYAVSATAARGSAGPLHLEVSDRSGEMADAAPRLDILEALTRATGGRVLSMSDRGDSLPLSAEREERVESAELRPLWRTWPAWLIVAGLACTEWWLRRRWGLA